MPPGATLLISLIVSSGILLVLLHMPNICTPSSFLSRDYLEDISLGGRGGVRCWEGCSGIMISLLHELVVVDARSRGTVLPGWRDANSCMHGLWTRSWQIEVFGIYSSSYSFLYITLCSSSAMHSYTAAAHYYCCAKRYASIVTTSGCLYCADRISALCLHYELMVMHLDNKRQLAERKTALQHQFLKGVDCSWVWQIWRSRSPHPKGSVQLELPTAGSLHCVWTYSFRKEDTKKMFWLPLKY